MGQAQVLTRELFLKGDQVGGAFVIAIDRPLVAPPGEASIGDVHIVRRAAHQADRKLRHTSQGGVAAENVFLRARDHMADGDRLARLGIRHQAVSRVLVVQVVDVGYRLSPAPERRVLHWIDDALPTKPDLTMVAQAAEKLGAGAGWHYMSLYWTSLRTTGMSGRVTVLRTPAHAARR